MFSHLRTRIGLGKQPWGVRAQAGRGLGQLSKVLQPEISAPTSQVTEWHRVPASIISHRVAVACLYHHRMVAALEGPPRAASQTYAGVVSFPRGVAVFSLGEGLE